MARKAPTTQLSLKALRAAGYTAAVVERWNSFVKIRQDLFGWIDIVAFKPGVGFLGVQTTTLTHAAERLRKARGNLALEAWLQAGGALQVDAWFKERGRWARRVYPVLVCDISAAGEGHVRVVKAEDKEETP